MLASSAAFEAASQRLSSLEADLDQTTSEHTSLHIGRARDLIIQARKQQRASEDSLQATQLKLQRVRQRQATAVALLKRGAVLQRQMFSVHGRVLTVLLHTPWHAYITVMQHGHVVVWHSTSWHIMCTLNDLVTTDHGHHHHHHSNYSTIACAKVIADPSDSSAALLILLCKTDGDMQIFRLTTQQQRTRTHNNDGNDDHGDDGGRAREEDEAMRISCQRIAEAHTAPWLLSAYGVASSHAGIVTNLAYVSSQRYFVCVIDASSSPVDDTDTAGTAPPASPSSSSTAAATASTPASLVRQTLLVGLDAQTLRVLWNVRPLSLVINAPAPPPPISSAPTSLERIEAEREHRILSLSVMQSGTLVVLAGTNWGMLLRFDVTVFNTARDDVTYEVSSHTWHHFTRHAWPTRARTAITAVTVNRGTTVAVACSDATIRVLSLFHAPTTKVKTHSTTHVVTTNIQTLSPLPPSSSSSSSFGHKHQQHQQRRHNNGNGGGNNSNNNNDNAAADDDDDDDDDGMALMMAKAAGPYAPLHICINSGGDKLYAFHPNGRLYCWSSSRGDGGDGVFALYSTTHTMSFNQAHTIELIGDDERIVLLDQTQWAIWRQDSNNDDVGDGGGGSGDGDNSNNNNK